ncbi:MAG: hypothetical protein AAFX52_14135 [Pseudomonadota bacterium]
MHIGQGKTGSSYIQSALALSTERLAQLGIVYPSDGQERERALSGNVSVGNLPVTKGIGHHTDGTLIEAMNQVQDKSAGRIMFSNEGLFSSIVHHSLWEEILEFSTDYDIRMLLFIRDPLDHALSAYQQGVKGGLTKPIGEFLQNYGIPRQTRKLIDLVEDSPVSLSILNYSRHRKTLLSSVAAWLGLPDDALVNPPKAHVNRSLTRTETELQIAFSEYVGSKARLFIADAFSNELPHLTAEQPAVDDETLLSFLGRMEIMTAETNALLSPNERYRVPTLEDARVSVPEPGLKQEYTLTQEQIQTLAKSVSRYLRPGMLLPKEPDVDA